tara:strand:- start:669 stop:911 length:243 start_codon:yes stop_codon:yes gene_type:complete
MKFEWTDENINLAHISENPWLYDDTLAPIDIAQWKLRNQCQLCGISPRHHSDDCILSLNQLTFARMAGAVLPVLTEMNNG